MLDLVYQKILKPIFFCFDPEFIHDFTMSSFLYLKPIYPLINLGFSHPDLQVKLAGKSLTSPIGLASGFDKNALYLDSIKALGFAFEEIGSVTRYPSIGNPKPRLFRLIEDEGLINRMGLNNLGIESISQRLLMSKHNFPYGINIAKTNNLAQPIDNEIEDILASFNYVKDLQCLYIAINLSCPNTKSGIIQEGKLINDLLKEIQQANSNNLPIFLKLSPDTSPDLVETFVDLGIRYNVQGYICGNTSVSRINLKTNSSLLTRYGNGGLSGKPIKQANLNLVRSVYKLKLADQEIIGCGGIFTGSDVFQYLIAGANVVQAYTGLIYQGPMFTQKANHKLLKLLNKYDLTVEKSIGILHDGFSFSDFP